MNLLHCGKIALFSKLQTAMDPIIIISKFPYVDVFYLSQTTYDWNGFINITLSSTNYSSGLNVEKLSIYKLENIPCMQ